MKKIFTVSIFAAIMSALNGCAVAGGIFKAGMWVGVLGVILIIVLIIYLVTRASNKS